MGGTVLILISVAVTKVLANRASVAKVERVSHCLQSLYDIFIADFCIEL